MSTADRHTLRYIYTHIILVFQCIHIATYLHVHKKLKIHICPYTYIIIIYLMHLYYKEALCMNVYECG